MSSNKPTWKGSSKVFVPGAAAPPQRSTSPPKSSKDKDKGTEWAKPSFTVAPPTRSRSPEPPAGAQTRGDSARNESLSSVSSASPGRRAPAAMSGVRVPSKEGGGNVGFKSDNEIFVLKENSDQSKKAQPIQVFHDQDGFNEAEIPARSHDRRTGVGYRPLLARKDTIIADHAMLETRLEWNQLLVGKVFMPYRKMLCELDDNLPDPDDLDAIDDDDFEENNEERNKIRDHMLQDPALNEREIAAFFEGFKLFQLKLNSLTSQVDGLNAQVKVLQNFPVARPGLVRSSSIASTGQLGRAPRSFEQVGRLKSSAAAMPPSPTSSLSSPTRSREDNVSDGKLDTPSGKAPEASLSPPPPRMFDASTRAMSIHRAQREIQSKGGNDEVSRLLKELEESEKRQKKLEKQLAQAGVVIAEDIPYDEAKRKVQEIATRMGEIGSSDVTHPDKAVQDQLRHEYFKLEQEMEKYTAALQLTDEWIEEQEEREREWEESVKEENEEALRKVRRHMPVEVRNMSEAGLTTSASPNGKFLPKSIAKKFKRTNVLQLLRIDPEDIVPMHPAALENMRVTGLTLTERRALYAHLAPVGPRWKAMQADKMTERKWTWFNMMKGNFKETVDSWRRHVEQYGPPGDHPYATRENPDAGCPFIGKQCPLKADKLIDYDGDYGYPEEAIYLKSDVRKSDIDDSGAKAQQEAQELAREKKAGERGDALKQHYKGKILQVSLANGSCEAMDEAMDRMENAQVKWVKNFLTGATKDDEGKKKEVAAINEALNELKLSVLQFADRSGMQLTGKRDANADQPDIRSPIELGLCEEVVETANEFFTGISDRMDELKVKDGRIKLTISQLQNLMEELHDRSMATLKKLGVERPSRSRKLKTRASITAEVKKELKEQDDKNDSAGGNASTPRGPPPGRGDLLSALGRGRGPGGDDGGGRGGLMAALAGRGRGGPGRGGIMAAIAARGNGGG